MSDYLSQVKQVAELRIGILTQCLALKNISDGRQFDKVIKNLVLKLHAKLNGINHVVQASMEFQPNFSLFQQEAVMVLGADVTHPSPGAVGNVSLLSLLPFFVMLYFVLMLN